MKQGLSILISIFLSILYASAQYSVTGGLGSPYAYTPKLSNTGIEKVYIFNTLSNAEISYQTTNGSIVRLYKYSSSLDDKVAIPTSDITDTSSSNYTSYTIRNVEANKGYLAEVDGKILSAIWIIDYSKHTPQFGSIRISEEDDKCDAIKLLLDKSDELFFYATNGSNQLIQRLYNVEYETLEWNDNDNDFTDKTKTIESIEIGTEVTVSAPLKDTRFTLYGDQFAVHFGLDYHILSNLYTATSVEAHIVADQVDSTESEESGTNLGGSAPAEINFYGKGNEPSTDFYTWYIYKSTDLANPILRYTDKDINYTFKESGDYVVKLEAANRTSSCTDTTSISLSITDFELKIPNVLLLDGTHEFKVTYKSILKFKCTIFNRWGNKIYEWTDPAKGWDGKYKGNYVSPGVYFYIISAEGSDGKNHKRSGDINVLRRK